MKRFSNHSFLLAIAVVVTVMVIGVYAYMYRAISQSVARTAEAHENVRLAAEKKIRDQIFLKTYESMSADWTLLPSFYIPNDRVVEFIEALESLGTQSGGTAIISSISDDVTDVADPGTIGNMHAHVEVSGSWTSVMRALSLAENMPYKVTVNGVNLSAEHGASAGKNSWSLSFDISALSMVPAKSTANNTNNVRSAPTPSSLK